MAQEIGSAYLTIKPKISDSFGSEVSKGGTGAGGKFGGAFSVAAGNLISNAVSSIANAAVGVFKDAFGNYANFEQLSGGVEKIFDQANISGIMEDANNAYKDLNMSANEYLESINQTGAAFAQTMGDQKGYDTARTGMKAISDYASGTGRDISELNEKFALITRATSSYQSIADQFSGILPATSADFLKQAQAAGFLSSEYTKLTDVPVAEYQEAVSKMLEKGVSDMGLAGNTLAESTNTISGSLAMLSGSWQNFLTGMFNENADIGVLGENLITSVGAVIQNIAPRIMMLVQRVILGLPEAIITSLQMLPEILAPTILAIFGEQLGGQINTAFSGGIQQLVATLQSVGASFMGLMQSIATTLQPVIAAIVSVIAAAMPLVQQAISIVLNFVTGKVIPLIQRVLQVFQPVIETIMSTVQRVMPKIQDIISKAMNAIDKIMSTIWPVVSNAVMTAAGIIQGIVETVWPIIEGIIDTVSGAIKTVSEEVWPAVSGFVEEASGKINEAINAIKPIAETVETLFKDVQKFIEDPIGTIQETLKNFGLDVDSVFSAITDPIETAQKAFEDARDTIDGIFDNVDFSFPDIALPHFSWDWWDVGGFVSVPSISVEWYGSGGIVNGAQLIGAGERGTELIWPSYDPYMSKYAQAIAEHMPIGGGGVDIHDCTFNVRKESDIRRVASELNNLINRQTAGVIA